MVEDLYNQRIKVAEAEEKKYRGIVKCFVEDVIVDQMMISIGRLTGEDLSTTV